MSSAALSSPRASVNKTAERGTHSMCTDRLLAPCGAIHPAGQYGGRVFVEAGFGAHGLTLNPSRPLA